MYALRLEQLFMSANPDQDPEASRDLQARFHGSIAPHDVKELDKECYMLKVLKQEVKIDWMCENFVATCT